MQRRQQWTLAIDGIRQELERGIGSEDELQENAVEQSRTVDELSMLRAQSVADAALFTPIEIAEDLDADLERNLDSSARRTSQPLWPANTGPALNAFHLPPQSIYATSTAKRNAEQTRWSHKKLLRAELSMDMLQLRFFQWLNRWGFFTSKWTTSMPHSYSSLIAQNPPHIVKRSFEQKQADFDRLLSTHIDETGRLVFERSPGDVPLCNYIEDDLGEFRHEQRELQRTLQRICSEEYQAELEPQLICRVFYHLWASSAPPNVDIYNTLINGLRKRKHVFLANAAIISFFSSKMRPNEVSLASILAFYTDTDNAERFRHVVQLMRGQKGGLMQSAPWNWRFKASKGRIIAHPDKPGQLIQLPHPTPMVLDAIVKGVLHFSGFDAALGMCGNLSDEGWGMDMRGFGILLNDCARRGDWDSGFAIWNQIVALKQRSSRLINGRLRTETIMTPLFADMLRLCRRCSKKQQFADVWDHAKKTHPRTISRIIEMVKAERSVHPDQRPAEATGSRETTESRDSGGSGDSAEAREEALEALAKLRATQEVDSDDGNLQQEYLALKADVDFLKTFEGSDDAEQPKVRSWAELARNAYSLIASHPKTLEKRILGPGKVQSSDDADEERPVTYTDLAKNAYHLVADHPSTMDRRRDIAPRSFDNNDVHPEEASDYTGRREPSQRLVEHSDQQQSKSVTYTSLAKNAYRLIADPSSMLERRDHKRETSQPSQQPAVRKVER